ncbi:MAG TPA: hypothetical protein VH561_14010 [Micromonosporaceae bacterium]|jgi:hypothetical protein
MPKPTSYDPFRRQHRDARSAPDDDWDDPAIDVETDLVPGDPPVPITTWRTPAERGGMSLRLAQRMLTAFTRRGQAVHDATGSPLLVQAVALLGRRFADGGSRSQAPEPAALVVCGWPPDRRGLDPAIVLGALRRRVADGGVLVVVATETAEPFDSGPVVRAATAARLAYIQHVVAVHAPIHGDHIHVPADDPPARADNDWALHRRVHTDLLAFTPAGGQHG